MRFKVYPYKQGSNAARMLAAALGGKVLKRENSKYVPKDGDVVVNWGSSVVPLFSPAITLNPDVSVASCKFKSLVNMQQAGVRVPPFVVNRDEIEVLGGWPVVCRTVLNGHSGRGIVIAQTLGEVVDAPLYTRYIKKKDEYRVHVYRGHAFFIQRKARKKNVSNPNWTVRNLEGGFSFVEVAESNVPQDVLDQALKALTAVGLDFGGVDVMWNADQCKAYVLEVNSACGLEERTADNYAGVLYADAAASSAEQGDTDDAGGDVC